MAGRPCPCATTEGLGGRPSITHTGADMESPNQIRMNRSGFCARPGLRVVPLALGPLRVDARELRGDPE